QHLEERQRSRLARVDQVEVGLDLLVRPDEPLGGQRHPVQADPLGDGGQVRAGEQPGAQPAGAQQGLGHPGGRRLAVGAGQVDHRVGALRVTEQLGQGPDPVQGRVDGMLGPAGHDGPLDLPQPSGYVGGHRAAQVAAITLGSLLPAGLRPDPPRWRTHQPGRSSWWHKLVWLVTRTGWSVSRTDWRAYRLAGGSASSRPVSRAISACAAASRSRLLATTAAGARSTNDGAASFRSVAVASARAAARSFSSRRRSAATSMVAAVSSSTVTPQACTDAVGANASPGAVSRSRARIAASCPASGVPPIPVSAAGTGWVGRSPWSERNRRTSVTSCISAPISASAAA